jgi:lipopolysaccharide transport system permease protein
VAVGRGQRDAVPVSAPGWLGSVRRAGDLLLTLVVADLRARYGRGWVRFAKWLFDPFAAVGVYLLLVTLILDRPGRAPGLSIACAVVAFQIVVMAVVSSMDAIKRRSSIILNMGFRRTLIPLSATLTEVVAFASSLVLLAGMMVIYDVGLTPAILWFPLVVAVNVLFAVACAYPATLIGLWYEDMRTFVISFVRAMFFLAPSLIPLSQLSGDISELIKLNPLTGLFEGYRDVLLYGQGPAAWELLYPLAFSVLLMAIWVPLFRSEQRHFAKMI